MSKQKRYDWLIVGAGLFGAVFAHEMTEKGKRCLVLEKRDHVGGNVYTEEQEGIVVHRYGAHIFHTDDKRVWEYVCRFADFNRFTNAPVAIYRGTAYNLPFNMNTFARMWGVTTPAEAEAILREQRAKAPANPQNLEEQAISLVGEEIYRTLIKEYTEKQWGRDCRSLPPFIIKRLPVRFTYDNNYFNSRYQGIPEGGYTPLVQKLLAGSDVRTGCDYSDRREEWDAACDRILYTGPVDRLFGYRLGKLAYRSLRFESETLDTDNYQGNAVVNYTSADVPYTRIIEHKHFAFGTQKKTIITREYPKAWEEGDEPYYAVNDEQNNALAARYRALAEKEGYLLGGRLATYRYCDMDTVIAQALDLAQKA